MIPASNHFQILRFENYSGGLMKFIRKDCCEYCMKSESAEACRKLIARCCPPGSTAKSSCADCGPCDDFEAPAFRKASQIRPYIGGHAKHGRPYATRKEARELYLRNAGRTRRGRLP